MSLSANALLVSSVELAEFVSAVGAVEALSAELELVEANDRQSSSQLRLVGHVRGVADFAALLEVEGLSKLSVLDLAVLAHELAAVDGFDVSELLGDPHHVDLLPVYDPTREFPEIQLGGLIPGALLRAFLLSLFHCLKVC